MPELSRDPVVTLSARAMVLPSAAILLAGVLIALAVVSAGSAPTVSDGVTLSGDIVVTQPVATAPSPTGTLPPSPTRTTERLPGGVTPVGEDSPPPLADIFVQATQLAARRTEEPSFGAATALAQTVIAVPPSPTREVLTRYRVRCEPSFCPGMVVRRCPVVTCVVRYTVRGDAEVILRRQLLGDGIIWGEISSTEWIAVGRADGFQYLVADG